MPNAPKEPLSNDEVRTIRAPHMPMAELCERFPEIGRHVLTRIRFGTYYKWLNDSIPPPPRTTPAQRSRRGAAKSRVSLNQQPLPPPRNAEEVKNTPAEAVILRRKTQAELDGGAKMLKHLEDRIVKGPRLSEREWEKLTRLRVALTPHKWESMQMRGVTKMRDV